MGQSFFIPTTMCGRFVQIDPLEELIKTFLIDDVIVELPVSYNIAPASNILAIVKQNEKRALVSFKWGYIPHWSNNPSKYFINARSETVHEKASFKNAFKTHRCLIIASGYYEWKKDQNQKYPHYITLKDRTSFAMAGIYGAYTYPDGKTIETCAILTTAANSFTESIHDRMPVIIPEESENTWLDTTQSHEKMEHLFIPSKEAMNYIEVSKIVNSPKNNSSECIKPV